MNIDVSIEWQFPPGSFELVAHLPIGDGSWEVVRASERAPSTQMAREALRALIRVAAAHLAAAEEAES